MISSVLTCTLMHMTYHICFVARYSQLCKRRTEENIYQLSLPHASPRAQNCTDYIANCQMVRSVSDISFTSFTTKLARTRQYLVNITHSWKILWSPNRIIQAAAWMLLQGRAMNLILLSTLAFISIMCNNNNRFCSLNAYYVIGALNILLP